MGTLWLLIVAVVGAGATWQAARRRGPGRRAADAHHRVLDTLEAMTLPRDVGAERDFTGTHQHVRLVRADPAAPPAADDADRPEAWRPSAPQPGRALGAAPFRAPVARHSLDALDTGSEPLAATADERVRVLRATEASPAQPSPAQTPAGAPPATPASVAPPPAPPSAPAVAALVFDTESVGVDTESPAAGPVVAPLAASTVAALVASAGLRGDGASRPAVAARRPTRRVRQRRAGAAVATGVAAAIGVVVLATSGGSGATPAARRSAPPPLRTATAGVTPSTAAPPPPATLISSTPQAAVYNLAGPATITFHTLSGSSWLQLRQGDQAGAVVFQGILPAGQTQTISGPAWVRLGNPTAVTVSVNGTTVTAPALSAGQPYNLQFR